VSGDKMKIREITDRLMPMLEDVRWAEEALEREDNQFTRRAYVRSLFALIEGSIWVLKQTVLYAPTSNGKEKRISAAEYALLSDKTYDLKSNGQPQEKVKFLKLPENFKFTFSVLEKYFKTEFDLGVGTIAWDNFLEAQTIRNRITHPKTSSEFKVTDSEIRTCKETCSWFSELVARFFNDLVAPVELTKNDNT
jgi:1,2-phenylacetyl-CoA epoxidase PaaB subunit